MDVSTPDWPAFPRLNERGRKVDICFIFRKIVGNIPWKKFPDEVIKRAEQQDEYFVNIYMF